MFHGKGGYDWETVYNMPLWLRKYTFHEIRQFYEKESDAMSGGGKGNKSIIDSKGNINKSEFQQVSNQYKGRTTYK